MERMHLLLCISSIWIAISSLLVVQSKTPLLMLSTIISLAFFCMEDLENPFLCKNIADVLFKKTSFKLLNLQEKGVCLTDHSSFKSMMTPFFISFLEYHNYA